MLVLGGTSDIGLAIVERFAAEGLETVWLAARPGPRRDAAVFRLQGQVPDVHAIDFDAEDVDSHPDVLARVAPALDLDLAVVAFGVLRTGEQSWARHSAAVHQAKVNYLAAVSVGSLLAGRFAEQGHGVLVALSSVAGERVRRSNFVYGASKAGFDAFFLGLGEELRDRGVQVVVVRPGFVKSKMTEGLDPAPLAVDPGHVAAAVQKAVVDGRTLVWVPSGMRLVMSVLRHVPRPLFRRLPM